MSGLVVVVLALVAFWGALEIHAARVLRRAEKLHLASLERQEERRAKGWTGR